MHINKNKLNWIQIDLTARCQASCLECSRNIDGKEINPYMGKPHSWDMPLDILKKALTPQMLSNNLQKVLLNGNFGDPCIHPQFLDCAKYIVEHAHRRLAFRIATNGAMFNNDYWKELAQIISPLKNHRVVFALDGLEDTHSIYRRGTKYQDVLDHARTFIEHGGKADWQFIVFDHNKHQREEAKALAQEYGFEQIVFRGDDPDKGANARLYTATISNNLEISGKETKKDKEVQVSKEQAPKGISKVKQQIKQATEQYKSKDNFLDTAPITCQYYDTKGMYVEYDGTVWMCCWTGDMHRRKDQLFGMDKISQEWKHIENRFGKDFNNLNNHSFDDILSHEFFADYLPKSFNSTRNDPNTPRLQTCAKTCTWNNKFV